jgi:hypothetical protein
MSRGKSNSFGVPHERQDGDLSPTEDELIEYGEDTWEVGLVQLLNTSTGWSTLTQSVNPKVHGLIGSIKRHVGSQTTKFCSAPLTR